jgi:hypothetical protein
MRPSNPPHDKEFEMHAYRFLCLTCNQTSIATATRSEAAHLADTHEQLHHAGAPTAAVIRCDGLPGADDPPVGARTLCESCRNALATTTWAHDEAGSPFDLCADCAALIPTTVVRARARVRTRSRSAAVELPVRGMAESVGAR